MRLILIAYQGAKGQYLEFLIFEAEERNAPITCDVDDVREGRP